ncbi:hypothetical protein RJ639_022724 [Escallonia herrerae]|uniref:Transposase (Putative), gypsy type n=1 Tax=Escallonia herrerae TaxID=1293975 RepID=A0AA88V1N8_9ASTE|nr:hypothetical protein RJ639_022724 [Escallonia herrerae]
MVVTEQFTIRGATTKLDLMRVAILEDVGAVTSEAETSVLQKIDILRSIIAAAVTYTTLILGRNRSIEVIFGLEATDETHPFWPRMVRTNCSIDGGSVDYSGGRILAVPVELESRGKFARNSQLWMEFKTGIYEEHVKSGYRHFHPFALRFFEHYHMAPGKLVPNGWRKLVGLIYLVETLGYKADPTDFMRVFFEICFVKRVANYLGWYYIHTRQRLLKGGPKSKKDFKNPGKPTPNNLTKYILSHIKLRGGLSIHKPLSEGQLEWAKIIPRKPIPTGLSIPFVIPSASSTETVPLGVSIDEDSIFRPRWTLRRDDLGMLDSQISEQHLLHGVLPRDKEMYTSGSAMLSRFEMARQVAAEEAQQKRDVVKKAEQATRRAEELSKQKADYIAQIMTLEKRLERTKRKIAKEVRKVDKTRDQGIRDFLDGNAGKEWLKKRTYNGLKIYEMGFMKAKEMFSEHFPDIPLDYFVMPAVVYTFGETAMPSEAGDAAASHPPKEGPSGDAPEPLLD